MIVLVTGDRRWTSRAIIRDVLAQYERSKTTVLVHGAANGADRLAGEVGEVFGFDVRPYQADWTAGLRGGPERNQRMLDEEHPQVVHAFHDHLEISRGTKDLVNRALRAGIQVYLHDHFGSRRLVNTSGLALA